MSQRLISFFPPLSAVISCVMFWATGYAFAFGSSANDFLSHSRFFLIDATTADYDSWFYHFSLLAIFIAIANGGFAERLRFWIYPIIAFFAAGINTECSSSRLSLLLFSENEASHKSSFIPRMCNLWNALPFSSFPASYSLPFLKSKINKLHLISSPHIFYLSSFFHCWGFV